MFNIIKWIWRNKKSLWIEYSYNIHKCWGKNIEFCKADGYPAYFRFYFLFIYEKQPSLID